jgi:hypothetical protein
MKPGIELLLNDWFHKYKVCEVKRISSSMDMGGFPNPVLTFHMPTKMLHNKHSTF